MRSNLRFSLALLFPVSMMLGVMMLAGSLAGQNVNPGHPEEIQVQKHASPEEIRARLAGAQIQKDAKELAALSTSVAKDMDQVQQGMLAAESLENLKKLEKLSKRVREELTQASR